MATIEVLIGGAAAGKTTRLLNLYRQALLTALENRTPGRTLWLSPSHHSVRDIRSRLIDKSLPAAFNPNVFRFDEFATRILERLPQPVVRVSPLLRRSLLRRIVDRQHADGKLKHFGAIAHTSGFLDLLGSFISELKRVEVWPDKFTEISVRGSHSPLRDRELAALYDEYQQLLLSRQLYDEEGRFWSAREALQQGRIAPFDQLSLVVVDGFTDFLHTQYEILELLAQRVDRLLVALPLESPVVRPDLFAKTQDVLLRLQRSAEVSVTKMQGVAPRCELPAGIAHVARSLFANPREGETASDSTGIEVIAEAGQLGEVQLLAARVKRLLQSGATCSDVVIAVRSLADYGDLLVDQFEASGIPVACEAGAPLTRTAPVRALQSVLRLEAEDWPFNRLMAVLNSSSFHPAWPEWRPAETASRINRTLRKLKLDTGRALLLKTLEQELVGLESRLQSMAESSPAPVGADAATTTVGAPPPEIVAESAVVEESAAASPSTSMEDASAIDAGETLTTQQASLIAQIADVRKSLALLNRLSEALAALRQPVSLAGWAEVLRSLAEDLGLRQPPVAWTPHADSRPRNPDAPVWEQLDAALADAGRADRFLTGTPTERTLADFLPELADLLQGTSVRRAVRVEGRVRILDAMQVRNLDVPHLFVAGLTETSFPGPHGDDCLFTERERQLLSERGVTLRHRSTHNQEEMLLFYGVVTRARKSLVLSYPIVSSDGHPLTPSPYLVALESLFDHRIDTLDERLDPVPLPDRVLTAADARVWAMHEALQTRPGAFKSLLANSLLRPAMANALSAIDMAVQRFHSQGFGQYEGRLQNPHNLESLAKRFAPLEIFSASQLEAYAGCPFRYFATNLLNVSEQESPEVEADAARRGSIVHDVLSQLHRQLKLEAGSHTPAGNRVTELFHELLAGELGRRPSRTELQKALVRLEQRVLDDWGRGYGQQWDDYVEAHASWDEPPQPIHLEAGFGPQKLKVVDTPLSPENLVVGSSGREVLLSGRIDRIDVGRREGRPMFTIIDYKTGKPQKAALEAVQSGQALQLAIYALAVQKLGLVDPDAVPFQTGYWAVSGSGYSSAVKSRGKGADKPLSEGEWTAFREALEEVVPKLAEGMRGGEFVVFNDNPHCMTYCPYRTTCRISQVRALAPQLGKRWGFATDAATKADDSEED